MGDFMRQVAPTTIGAAGSMIPGVGPVVGPMMGAASNQVLNGGPEQGAQMTDPNGQRMQQMQMLAAMMQQMQPQMQQQTPMQPQQQDVFSFLRSLGL